MNMPRMTETPTRGSWQVRCFPSGHRSNSMPLIMLHSCSSITIHRTKKSLTWTSGVRTPRPPGCERHPSLMRGSVLAGPGGTRSSSYILPFEIEGHSVAWPVGARKWTNDPHPRTLHSTYSAESNSPNRCLFSFSCELTSGPGGLVLVNAFFYPAGDRAAFDFGAGCWTTPSARRDATEMAVPPIRADIPEDRPACPVQADRRRSLRCQEQGSLSPLQSRRGLRKEDRDVERRPLRGRLPGPDGA